MRAYVLRLGNFKLRGGGEKPIAANEFHENAFLGAGQAKLDGKALGRGIEVGGRVNDEKGGGRPVEVEACHGPVPVERNDMGEKRRVSPAWPSPPRGLNP